MIYIIAPCNLDIKRDMIFLFMYALVSAGVSTSSESITPRALPRLFAFCINRRGGRMRLGPSAPLFPGVQGQMHRATLLLQRTHFFQSARLRKGNADSLRASASRRERARVCVAIFILKVPLAERERETQLTHLCAGCSLFSLCATAFGWNFSAEAKHA